MKTFKVNTIQDIQGNKLVLTDENGISKLWYGEFYEFKREINQVSYVDVYEIQADGFNHAIDKIKNKEAFERITATNKSLRLTLESYEDKIIKKFGNKLRGVKRQTKLNTFLR